MAQPLRAAIQDEGPSGHEGDLGTQSATLGCKLAFLVSIAVTDTSVPTAAPDVTGPRPFLPDPRLPIRLTVAEARHLIAALITEPVHDTIHLLRWSTWRRLHQSCARAHHYKTRSTDP